MTILDDIDAALAEADDTVAALCDAYLADALVGVREALAGASGLPEPYCDALDCSDDHGARHGTLSRCRPPELGEEITHGPGHRTCAEPDDWVSEIIQVDSVHGTVTIRKLQRLVTPGAHFLAYGLPEGAIAPTPGRALNSAPAAGIVTIAI